MASFWDKIRKDFPVTKECIYLDHAAGGPVPLPVQSEIQKYLQENSREADFAWPKWMKRSEAAHESVARFIHADPDEIAFVHSTSQAMNCVAEMLAEKGKVLTNTSEFPSSTLPWVWRKADMIFQEPAESEISLQKMKSLLSPKVKTVLTSYVQYATGFRQDLKAVGRLKGDRFLVVNATQAFGVLPIDVRAWKADFLCANSYKWLMAGYGGGVLFIRRKWLKALKPLSIGWRSVRNADKMDNRRAQLLPGAARYEFGCPSFGTIFAVKAAVEYLSAIGIEKIERRILDLTDYAVQELERRGFDIASSLKPAHRSGIVIVRWPRAEELWKRLLAKKIFVTARGEGIRLAPHFYNSFKEIDDFVGALVKARDPKY